MKISEIKGEQALDVLADLIEPAAEIMADKDIRAMYEENKPYVKMIGPAIKNHKKAVITILAILDGKDPEEYEHEISLITLPKKVFEIINDEELMMVFQSQGQMMEEDVSGSAMENIVGRIA